MGDKTARTGEKTQPAQDEMQIEDFKADNEPILGDNTLSGLGVGKQTPPNTSSGNL